MKNCDIVVIGLQPWDIEIGSNCKDIAREFARHNRVLYVNTPLDRHTVLGHRKHPEVKKRLEVFKGRAEDLVQEMDNLWVLNPRTIVESISRLPWNWLFDRMNAINNRRFAGAIRSAIDRLQFKDYILFNDGSMFRGLYMKELLRPKLSIYYSRDNFQESKFWRVQGPRIEPEIISKSDLVLVNSTFLETVAHKYNSRTYYIGQGCDLSLYDRKKGYPVPPDIEFIPQPVIGYTGAVLSIRLDIGILEYIARERPGWNIVLVGPEDEEFSKSSLHGIPNIHFLGSKKPEELPAYVNRFDVGINPQLVNRITLGNYPRKVDEYLALGKPVVATDTPAMSLFSSVTYLATSREDYVKMIERALSENSPERIRDREDFAQTHSWEANVREIYRLVHQTLAERVQNPPLKH